MSERAPLTERPGDIVGLGDIAEFAGTTRQAVNNWTKRYEDFPVPVTVLRMGRIYDLAEVEDWLRKTERIE